MRLTRLGRDDTGSTLILVIFYAALCLAVILLGTAATSLYLERKRLFSLADGAALAAAQNFTTVTGSADMPRFELTDTAVADAAARYLAAVRSSDDVVLLRADTPDGVAARIELRTEWQPPLVSAFVSTGVPIEVTSTATVSVE